MRTHTTETSLAGTLLVGIRAAVAALTLAALAGCSSITTKLVPTSITLTSSTSATAGRVTLNGPVTLTATLSGVASKTPAIGTVTFYDGTTELQAVYLNSSDTVSATVSSLTTGAHQITAVYGGDQTYATSTSAAVGVGVNDPTTLTIASNLTLAGIGDPIVLTAIASVSDISIPTGSVTFTVTSSSGTSTIGTASLTTVSGVATATLTYNVAAPLGIQTFNASLAKNGYFLGSATTVGVPVNVHPPLLRDTVTLTGSLANNATIASGTADILTATIVPISSGTAGLTGTVTFYDGTVAVGTAPVTGPYTAGVAGPGTATLSVKQFVTGAAGNTLTAYYSGDAVYAPNYSTNSLALTVNPYTGPTYTNPLNLTDNVNGTGKVYNCPDPAIIKYQIGGADTWYAYCTGDAFNSADTVSGNFRAHLISIFSSSDLVNWSYVRDAFLTLPAWVANGNELQTPAIKFINGQYLLYYEAPAVKANPGGSAIGVGVAATPAGPFIDSGGPVVNQQTACGGGCNRTVFSPEVLADKTGQLWIAYGGVFAGLSIRQLSSNGLTSNAGTEINIAVDNYYTNPYLIYKNGFFYEFATPAGNCCGGSYSTYSVRVGRSANITGPYLDAEGNDMNAYSATSGTNGAPGGDTVLVNTGNTIVGPGSNTTFTDEAGQDYIFYSAVSTNQQYLPLVTGYTARQLMMDPLDWVNGWPVVRNGTGDSDAAQPVPAAQPGAANGYIPPAYTADAPGTALAAYSQDFTGATAFASQFSVIHGTSNLAAGCLDPGNGYAAVPGVTPGFGATGFTLCSAFGESTNVPGTGYNITSIPIPAEAEPSGNYMVEIKFHSLTPPTGCCSYNFPAQGLMIYNTDTVYLRLDDFSDYDTRQIEFLNQFGENTSNSTAYVAFAPVGTPHNALYTYLRLAKRITNTATGAATYTSYSSVDGVNYVRGPAWNVNYGSSAKIGIFADNLAEGATFSYIHVSTLTP
jgi:arabinan endo-1,5-alpha-L-arabinosidase